MSCSTCRRRLVLAQCAIGPVAGRDVTLDPEVPGDAPLSVVETEIVPFDPDRRPIDSALVGLDVEPAAIEEVAPDRAAGRQVVSKQIGRGRAEERLARGAILRQHRVVDLGDTLMLEDVVERLLFVDRVVPGDGLVEHHEEKAVERLREEQLETIVGFHGPS